MWAWAGLSKDSRGKVSLEGAEALRSWKETEGAARGQGHGKKGGGPDRNGALVEAANWNAEVLRY